MITTIRIYKTVFIIPLIQVDQPVAMEDITSINISPSELPTHEQINQCMIDDSHLFQDVNEVYYLVEDSTPPARFKFVLFTHGD